MLLPKCFGTLSWKKDVFTKNLHNQHCIHFLTMIHASGGFPSKSSSEATAIFVLRIHGRLGLEEPLEDRNVALLGCEVQRCVASGAAAGGPSRRQNLTEGENLKKFWRLKRLEAIELVENHMLILLYVAILLKPCRLSCHNDWDKFKLNENLKMISLCVSGPCVSCSRRNRV